MKLSREFHGCFREASIRVVFQILRDFQWSFKEGVGALIINEFQGVPGDLRGVSVDLQSFSGSWGFPEGFRRYLKVLLGFSGSFQTASEC